MNNVKSKVIDLLAKQLRVAKPSITTESRIEQDLGADSLDSVEIIMELEDVFDLSIPDDEAEKLTTVQEIIDYIESNIVSQ